MIRPFILAACDTRFHDWYGKALENSAAHNGMSAWVFNTGLPAKTEQDRCYCSALRYLLLPEMLKQHEAVLCLDTDSLVMEPVDFDDKWDLGLFLRTGLDQENMKILATAMYVKCTALKFALDLREILLGMIANNEMDWCWDQTAIWRAYSNNMGFYHTLPLDETLVNWLAPAPIWTGKGTVKKNDKAWRAAVNLWKNFDVHDSDSEATPQTSASA